MERPRTYSNENSSPKNGAPAPPPLGLFAGLDAEELRADLARCEAERTAATEKKKRQKLAKRITMLQDALTALGDAKACALLHTRVGMLRARGARKRCDWGAGGACTR